MSLSVINIAFNRKYFLGEPNMKKRTIGILLALIVSSLLCTTALAITLQASGQCYMSNSGRSVSFNGYSESAQTEDTIGVTVILWEKRGSTWYEVARSSNSTTKDDYVGTAGSKIVTGGYYYKVTGTHTSSRNGKSYSVSSETASKWIP